jgi:hypothetical protein
MCPPSWQQSFSELVPASSKLAGAVLREVTDD